MKRSAHRIYIGALVLIVACTFAFLLFNGISYYSTGVEERAYHENHLSLKPGGVTGHGAGIIGSFLMVTGIFTYMARKRMRLLSRLGLLKHWLEFHIFLCTLGPLLILFHTAFKFGGIVAVSFWSMTAVFLSGIIGRFIYLQIPRSIEGRELTMNEIRKIKNDVEGAIKDTFNIQNKDAEIITESLTERSPGKGNLFSRIYIRLADDRKKLRSVKEILKKNNLSREKYLQVLSLAREEIKLGRKIDQLALMQEMFRYWHVVHLPFAMVMLIIMVIHIAVTLLFGYRWIF